MPFSVKKNQFTANRVAMFCINVVRIALWGALHTFVLLGEG